MIFDNRWGSVLFTLDLINITIVTSDGSFITRQGSYNYQPRCLWFTKEHYLLSKTDQL